MTVTKTWTSEDAARLYRIREWSNGYFDVSGQGEMTVKVNFPSGEVQVSLWEILQGIRDRGLQLPLLLRIENLLDAQIVRLNEGFRSAITRHGYRGSYQGVFPIKVNQQRQVVEEIARFGAPYQHGLEAGSKAELVIALASLPPNGSMVVCNGYKDAEFIDLGLRACQLGYRCVFVLETPAELPLILQRSRELGIKPLLGARIKLTTRVGGHWNLTSGDRSIFGLSITQLTNVIDQLKRADMLDALCLLHSHLGSQIPDISDIRSAVVEACRYYRELVTEGAAMQYLDFGGGLAVDYLGNASSDSQSCNYKLEEYCNDIIETVMTTLDESSTPHPTVITESGRPTVAYYSLLLFNIFDVTSFAAADLPKQLPESHPLLQQLVGILGTVGNGPLQQSYERCLATRDQLHELFKCGELSLRDRALAQNLVLAISRRVLDALDPQLDQEQFASLHEQLADIYYGNLSVFQSLPDHWAIGQLFPVLPIHRLNEKPGREVTIADITCDSDGRIARFIGEHGPKATLALHPFEDGDDYVLGTFLVGAYQETLGDLHNLFGDTNVASVRIDADGSWELTQEVHGDSVSDLIGYVQYDDKQLRERFRQHAEQAVKAGRINVADRKAILERFLGILQGGSYYQNTKA